VVRNPREIDHANTIVDIDFEIFHVKRFTVFLFQKPLQELCKARESQTSLSFTAERGKPCRRYFDQVYFSCTKLVEL
jgi:hypothetical protein